MTFGGGGFKVGVEFNDRKEVGMDCEVTVEKVKIDVADGFDALVQNRITGTRTVLGGMFRTRDAAAVVALERARFRPWLRSLTRMRSRVVDGVRVTRGELSEGQGTWSYQYAA